MHNIHLDQFEGPLDLLLYFIRKDEIDIYDIPISKITYDYLNVINKMNLLNVSIAGEFVLMAATLMKIKSKIFLILYFTYHFLTKRCQKVTCIRVT